MWRCLAFVLMLFETGAAVAGDGVLEINQTCAVQTGCFPGDDPGFPVTLSSAGASYRLTSSLVMPNENTGAIEVAANGIGLDLGGFEIRGVLVCTGGPPPVCTPSAGSGWGIVQVAPGTGDVSVRNGTVRGMGSGGIGLGARSKVTDVRLLFNENFALAVGDNSQVSRNTVVQNGVTATVISTAVVVGDASTVSDNTVVRNGGTGIHSNATSGVVVTGNVVSHNGLHGINVGAGSTIAHNTSSNNRGSGIVASASTITNNTAFNNVLEGISATSGSLVIANTASDNDRYGLSLGTQSGYRENVLNGNTLGAVNGTSILNLGNNACNGVPCP